jgi:uncharacterized protein
MKLDLTRYRKPFAQFSRTFQPEEVGDEHEAYRVVAPVELAFDIHKDKDKFRLEGTVRSELELPCSRCLEPYRLPIDAAFDIRYLPASQASTDVEQEVGEGDLETSFYRDDEIDVNELLREQFYLALPMKPLCSDACKGLCPQCGTNLNTGTCDCAPGWQDPRLAALRDFGKARES